MGLNVDELKKINVLSLDDHTDDTNLDKIRSELVSCDDSIRLIAKSPALTGETQDAVTQALAQLQAEVRKWHGLVASVHAQRTTARDAMRTAKPKFDALPATTGDQVHQGPPLLPEYQTDVDPDPTVEAQREAAASEAITPMDSTLSTAATGLKTLDFKRPIFDPNRAVDQTPLPTTSLNGDAGGDGSQSAGSTGGAGASGGGAAGSAGGAGGSGSGGAAGYAGNASTAGGGTASSQYESLGGSGAHSGLITPGAQAAGSVSGIADAAGHYGSAMDGHSAGTLDGLIRNGFVGNTSGASATPVIAAGTTSSAFLARKSRGNGSGNLLKGAGGFLASLAGIAGLAGMTHAAGSAMGAASAYTAAGAASGATGLAGAGSASSPLGVNGTTGGAAGAGRAGAAGSAQGQGSTAAGRGTGMGGRPMGGAPGHGAGGGSRRGRKRARGVYDVPVFEEPERVLPAGDPGPSGEAGSRATIGAIREWVEESDTW